MRLHIANMFPREKGTHLHLWESMWSSHRWHTYQTEIHTCCMMTLVYTYKYVTSFIPAMKELVR